MTAAPAIQPYFKVQDGPKASFPTGRNGILPMLPVWALSAWPIVLLPKKARLPVGSVVIDLKLPPTQKAANPYSNCLYYVNKSCKACIARCPAAPSPKPPRQVKCGNYQDVDLKHIKDDFQVGSGSCGLCQPRPL